MWARRAQSSANNGDGQQEDVKIVIQKYGGDACLLTKNFKYNTRKETMQVTIMDDILKKQKHASHFERENQASNVGLFVILYGKLLFYVNLCW